MKKTIMLLLFSLFALPTFAQAPQPSALFDSIQTNCIPKVGVYAGQGLNHFSQSNLCDNGTQLLYNGAPLGFGNPLASGSTVLPSQALRIPVAARQMPTTGWTAYHAFGDSITAGSDATTAANRYVNLIDAAVGSPTLTNFGVAGTTGCDVTNSVFNNENPGASNTTLYTLMDGKNDVPGASYVGTGIGQYEPVFNLCELASLSWLTVPSTLKYTGASFGTIPTNWSADNTFSTVEGIQSTTNGAAASFPYTTTVAGQQVFVWYRLINSNGGQFLVSDTGSGTMLGSNGSKVIGGSLPNFTIPAMNFLSGGTTSSVGVAILDNRNRAAGTYSVTITVSSTTSASNVVSILAVGVAPPAITSSTPAVWAGGVIRYLGEWNQTANQAYDSDVANDVSLLSREGLPVYFVNVSNYFLGTSSEMGNGTATSNCSADTSSYYIHPCNTGHAELAQAFLAQPANPSYQTILPYNDPSQYNTVNTAGSSQTLTCSQQSVIVTSSSSITLTLPSYCPTGKTFLVQNAGTGTVGFVQSISGGGNVSGIALYPGYQTLITSYQEGSAVGSAWYGTTQPVVTFNGRRGAVVPVESDYLLHGVLTMTTATSDSLTLTGVTASSYCSLTPTNSTAAASSVAAYVASVASNTVTVSHVATSASGGTLNVICTPN